MKIIMFVILFGFVQLLVAEANLITWNQAAAPSDDFQISSQNAIVADSDVYTGGVLNGTNYNAVRYNAISSGHVTGGADVTVNGVDFRAIAIKNGPITDPNYTRDGITIKEIGFDSAVDTSSANAPFTGLSSNYQAILGTDGVEAGGGNKAWQITGLRLGEVYSIQIWSNNSASNNNRTFLATTGHSFDYQDGSTGSVYAYDQRVNNTEGELGSYFLGTFTVDNNPFPLLQIQSSGTINAIAVSELALAVPEPSSLALLSLALLGLYRTQSQLNLRTSKR